MHRLVTVPREQAQFDEILLCRAVGNPPSAAWRGRVCLAKGRGTGAVGCCQCHNALSWRWCWWRWTYVEGGVRWNCCP